MFKRTELKNALEALDILISLALLPSSLFLNTLSSRSPVSNLGSSSFLSRFNSSSISVLEVVLVSYPVPLLLHTLVSPYIICELLADKHLSLDPLVSPTPMYAIVTYILSMPSNYLGKKMTV
jgi:hypothetical protein